MSALPDPAGYRAAHEHLERQVARLTDDNAALRGLLEQAILRLASATGNTEQVIRCELGAPPRPSNHPTIRSNHDRSAAD